LLSSYRSPETLGHLRGLHRDYMEQPFEISLETLALCNAACTFCPYPTLERKGEKMPSELIYRLIDEMAGFTLPFTFSPFKVNEPLLDKRIFDICDAVAANTLASIRIFTNGSPLTAKNIDRLAGLESIEHVWISLNSVNWEEYQDLMGLEFDKVARNLDRLHNTQDFPHPVVVSSVGVPNDEFIRYCKERWPRFRAGLIPNAGWLGYVEPDYHEIPNEPCSRWWELSVMSSGVVSLCCMHSGNDNQWNIGDLNNQSLLEVYNSPHWRERREELISRREIEPCWRCTY